MSSNSHHCDRNANRMSGVFPVIKTFTQINRHAQGWLRTQRPSLYSWWAWRPLSIVGVDLTSCSDLPRQHKWLQAWMWQVSWLSPRPGRPFSPCVTSSKWGYSRLHSLMIKFGVVGWLWELNPLLHTKGLGLCLGYKQQLLPLTKPMLSVYCLRWPLRPRYSLILLFSQNWDGVSQEKPHLAYLLFLARTWCGLDNFT